jgi:hypothetical protein
MRRSTVLSLPPQLVFPGFAFPFVLRRSILNDIVLGFSGYSNSFCNTVMSYRKLEHSAGQLSGRQGSSHSICLLGPVGDVIKRFFFVSNNALAK